ncbi:MAG: thiol:disulfide interchange protein DsbA/DsbL [Pseudomonadales bacterium]|jgi:thiol:disulfide interchange protein DsbA|nr:thiol:disulfide interchange protein DsbA/DsbL [Pseudomonadales bacterium]MDA0761131.1 thiol:disulfide interchange protein DsbA/DsbL [Pseudomonadota bacterium]MDA0956355.1 thiol:disulfide interchange protein DsbA/DsbL [Pseudomonadota bacterium]MDA1206733.1 thiol:disulfide interchange protein DsbA/DsbL [Pseudomonadota bacterium]
MVRRKTFVQRQKFVLGAIALLVAAIIGYLTIETVTDDGAQGEFVAGIHYVELNDPRRIRGDAIEVMEFFSYGCIFCYRFDDDLSDWAEDYGDKISLVRTPLIGSDQWRLLGQHYYALERLEAPDVLHQATFRAIHDLGRNLSTPGKLADFVETNSDISQEDYLTQLNSPSVMTRVGLADRIARQARITSVPQLVVQGRYRISSTRDVGPNRMLEVADYLIDKILAERSANQSPTVSN